MAGATPAPCLPCSQRLVFTTAASSPVTTRHSRLRARGILARFAGTRLYTVAPSSELMELPHDAIPAPWAPWLPCYVVSWKRVSRRSPSPAGGTLHFYGLTTSITLLPDHHAYRVRGDDLMHYQVRFGTELLCSRHGGTKRKCTERTE